MRLLIQAALGGCLALAVLTTATPARTEPSGWAQFGSGATYWQMASSEDYELSPSLTIDAGLGSDATAPFIVGGLFRLHPVIGHGTDVSWLVRGATRGFQSEWFGFAVDAGPYVRGWGDGSAGIMGQGLLGGPFGLQLAVLGGYGTNEAKTFGLTLGLDFARLTVHRKHLLDWWPNPRPVETLDDRAHARH